MVKQGELMTNAQVGSVVKGRNARKRTYAGRSTTLTKAATKKRCENADKNYQSGYVTKKGTVVAPVCRKIRADKNFTREEWRAHKKMLGHEIRKEKRKKNVERGVVKGYTKNKEAIY